MNTRGVAAEEVEEWLRTTQGQSLEEDSAESADRLFPVRLPLVPSSDDVAPIGYILVGPRPDGSIASKDEQSALREVSESIARGVRNVIKREARERQVTDRIEANARRIEELEALLAAHPSPRLKQAPGPG
jgi:hypothetical protein